MIGKIVSDRAFADALRGYLVAETRRLASMPCNVDRGWRNLAGIAVSRVLADCDCGVVTIGRLAELDGQGV